MSATKPTARPRITAIEYVRIFVVAAVIATHIMATGPLYNSTASGVIWMISHASRNLFIMLSALVLAYSYGPGRPFNVRKFYLKRFPFILVPYAVWSLIYQIRFGVNWGDPLGILAVFGHNLLTGDAMYHLYFLLITMQMYALFPLIRYLYEKVQIHPIRLLAGSFIFQIIETAFMHYWPHLGVLSFWLESPAKNILSYQLYIVIGVMMAARITEIETLVIRWRRQIYATTLFTSAVGLGLYAWQVTHGALADYVTNVFQPYSVIESVMLLLTLFAAGFGWVNRGAKGKVLVSLIAEDSFGIYLAHLFVISWLQLLQPAANDWLTGVVTVLIGLPAVYIISFVGAELVRHTPASLMLTGRKRTTQSFRAALRRLQPAAEASSV